MNPSLALAVLCLAASPHAASAEHEELLSVEIADLGECRGCAGSLERSLGKLRGVIDASLHESDPVVTLRLESEVEIDVDAVRGTVRDKGYTAGRIEVVWLGAVDARGFTRSGSARAWPLRWLDRAQHDPSADLVLLRAALVDDPAGPLLEVSDVSAPAD